MPDTLQSLADSVKVNDVSVRDMGASNIFNKALFLQLLNFTPATNGTVHKYLRESTAPVVGFREPNAGIDTTAGADELVTVNLKFLDAVAKLDKSLAEAGRGADYNMGRQGLRNLRQAFFMLESQVFNGDTAGGFSGLKQALNALGPMCISAGDVFANNLTSVYMIRTTPDEQDLMLVGGNDGNIKMDPYYPAQLLDATGKPFNGFVMPIDGWFSIQLGGSKSIARAANIGTAAGKGCTDNLLSLLFDTFPAEAPPTHIVMNVRSRGQLQRDRSSLVGGGAKTPLLVQTAPLPVDWNGIPIVTVGTIYNNETLVA